MECWRVEKLGDGYGIAVLMPDLALYYHSEMWGWVGYYSNGFLIDFIMVS